MLLMWFLFLHVWSLLKNCKSELLKKQNKTIKKKNLLSRVLDNFTRNVKILLSFISLVLKSQLRDSQQQQQQQQKITCGSLVFWTITFGTGNPKGGDCISSLGILGSCATVLNIVFFSAIVIVSDSEPLNLLWLRWISVAVSAISWRRVWEMLLWSQAELGLNPSSTMY